MIGYWGSNNQRRARDLQRAGYHTTSRSRVAARLAALTGCSIHEAAQDLGVSAGGAWHAWSRIYPGKAHPATLRRRVAK